jgi:hypothetical protein
MVAAQEPIVHPHMVLDTTTILPHVLARQLSEYWLVVEEQEVPGIIPYLEGG